ncbi:MAG: SDR family oxidoreductase [Gammaproteobacteria bacterium]|nr:SDR family oxidoreductase [Gammaproteobacteria bacterium]MBU1481683.1 SDR family oxidoreductase [Gammaproteobacteria bacterium]
MNKRGNRIAVTGASGFVGHCLCAEIARRGGRVKAILRTSDSLQQKFESFVVGQINGHTDWAESLRGVDVVIHLAARVHVMHEEAANPLDEFRKVNVVGTERLARQAARAGVKRLVFVSSIKVNGENTLSPPFGGTSSHSTRPPKDGDQVAGYPARGGGERKVFAESDIPSARDPYGISKWEAEQALHRVAAETGLEIVIVRPPLVYGPGVKGNFAQMLKAIARGIPLPLASVHNLRSLLYVENLVDSLLVCATHPAAVGRTYLVSDGDDVSTPDLLRQLGNAMGLPARLFPFPPAWLKLGGRLIGKADQVERLLGSLRVDSGKIRRELNWKPPYTLQQGLQATAARYH